MLSQKEHDTIVAYVEEVADLEHRTANLLVGMAGAYVRDMLRPEDKPNEKELLALILQLILDGKVTLVTNDDGEIHCAAPRHFDA